MSKRHNSIGIKQIIHYEWMEKTSSMLLAGMDAKSIRKELNDYLIVHKSNSSEEIRSKNTCKFAVNNLMKIWVQPDPDLIKFRDKALELLQKNPSQAFAIHWAMISAAYPFWFNVSLQFGRLFDLQDKITHRQIVNRLKERYGDRQTVTRNARYVIRSLVEWGILTDTNKKGLYEKTGKTHTVENETFIFLLESVLHTIPEGKGYFKVILSSFGLFPFQLPLITVDYISSKTASIDIFSYGVDEYFIELHKK